MRWRRSTPDPLGVLRSRLDRFGATMNSRYVLEAAALDDAERVLAVGTDRNCPHLRRAEAVFLVASLHWYRWQVLPAGQDEAERQRAVQLTEVLLRMAPETVPPSMRAMLGMASRQRPAAAGPEQARQWFVEAVLLMGQAEASGDYRAVDRAESLLESAVAAGAGPELASYLSALGKVRRDRYQRNGDRAALVGSVEAHRQAVAATAPGDSDLATRLFQLGTALGDRYDVDGDLADLDESVDLLRRAARGAGPGPVLPMALTNLGNGLRQRWSARGNAADLDEAVEVLRDARSRQPRDVPQVLIAFGTVLAARVATGGSAEDLDEAIGAYEAALARPVAELPHPGLRQVCLVAVAALRATRYERGLDRADLDDAIGAYRSAADGADEPEHRTELRFQVGRLLSQRYERAGAPEDLTAALTVLRDVVAATSDGHPDRADRYGELGATLGREYTHSGEIGALHEAVAALRNAVAATDDDDPDRSAWQSNLGNVLRLLFERTGAVELLDEASTQLRAAVAAAPGGDPKLPAYLVNLGLVQQHRYGHTGDRVALTEAVATFRRAVSAAPPGHPDRVGALTDLGVVLNRRVEERLAAGPDGLWGPENPDGTGPGFPERQPDGTGPGADPENAADPENDEALRVLTEAVELADGTGPVQRMEWLVATGTLGMAHLLRHRRTGDRADVDAAVAAFTDALDAAPAHLPYRADLLTNLGGALLQLAHPDPGLSPPETEPVRPTGGAPGEPLRRAVEVLQAAVAGTTATDPARTMHLFNLGIARKTTGDPGGALAAFREAAGVQTAPSLLRTRAAWQWARLAEEESGAPAALPAYETAVGLLDLVAWRGLDRDDQERLLAEFAGLAAGAAACAIAAGQPSRAVELLEQGRGVLLAQALDADGDRAELWERAPQLAERLARVQTALEGSRPRAGGRVPGDRPVGTDGHPDGDTVDPADRQALARERRDLLAEIRRQPGLTGYLLPPPFPVLAEAAANGPVVIVNVSDRRGDALIVTSDGVRVVPLPELTMGATVAHVASFLTALVVQQAPPAPADPAPGERPTTSAQVRRRRLAAQHALRDTLRWLWDAIANPVLAELGHTRAPGEDDAWPRLWWCPTNLLTLLPLHAAGDGTQRVLDLVVSSYTPTLRALRHARRSAPPGRLTGALLVALPETPGQAALPGTVREEAALASSFPRLTRLTGASATRSAVLDALPAHRVAHFACHGGQDLAAPARGRLWLHDGPLYLRDLLDHRFTDAELAFLSACETSRGGIRLADETLTLASALQLAGYRQVIGALWAVGDNISAEIAAEVYRRLTVDSGGIEPTGAAVALHHAVRQAARRHPGQPELWAPYLHLGP